MQNCMQCVPSAVNHKKSLLFLCCIFPGMCMYFFFTQYFTSVTNNIQYFLICKALDFQKTTVRIIQKRRIHGTDVNLLSSGQQTKVSRSVFTTYPVGHKEPITSKTLQASLALSKV